MNVCVLALPFAPVRLLFYFYHEGWPESKFTTLFHLMEPELKDEYCATKYQDTSERKHEKKDTSQISDGLE